MANGKAPVPDNSYGSPGEESQRVFRTIRGTRTGTRIGPVVRHAPKVTPRK